MMSMTRSKHVENYE